MNQNSKKSKGKQLIVYYLGKRFKLHDFLRKKAKLRKLGGKPKPKVDRGIYRDPVNRRVRLPHGHLPQKRHGVMTNNTVNLPGLQTSRYTTSSGTSNTTVNVVVANTSMLRNVESHVGDFKHPNDQRFTHTLVTPWTGLQLVHTDVNASWDQNEITGPNVQPWGSIAFNPTYPSSVVYNKALSRLYDKLRGDIDLSIDLAESHKTMHMMRDTVKSMASLATTFRKMKRSNPRDWGNLWLEFTYGWKPLASSIYESAQKLMAPGPQGPEAIRVKVGASERMQLTQTRVEETPGIFKILLTRRTERVRFNVLYNIVPSRLNELAGFTSLNPVSVAWELTPYSFVVDWFVDVGGYLRNYENALLYGTDFVDGYMTRSSLGEFIGDWNGSNLTVAGVFRTTTIRALHGSERVTEKTRTRLASTPYPRRPRFSPHLGASRLISGAALLGQMLDSLKHSKSYGESGFWLQLSAVRRKRESIKLTAHSTWNNRSLLIGFVV